MSFQSAEPLLLSHRLLHLVFPIKYTIESRLKSSSMANGVHDAWEHLFAACGVQ